MQIAINPPRKLPSIPLNWNAISKKEKFLGEGRFWNAFICTDLSSGVKVVVKALSKRVSSKHLSSYRTMQE